MVLMGLAACVMPHSQGEAPPRQSAARDSLLSFDRSRGDSLVRRGIEATMHTFLDSNAIYLRAGAHASYGSDRAIALIMATPPHAPVFTSWQPIGGALSRDGLAAYTFGIAVRSLPEQSAVFVERYVAYWARRPGQPWRISAYIEVSPGSLSTVLGEKPIRPTFADKTILSLLAADSTFSERTATLGPAVAVRGAMAPEGLLITGAELVVGPRAAAEYFKSRRSFSLSWVPRDARLAASGDLGMTVGEALSTSATASGVAMQQFTKYLTVWGRDGGSWRVLVTGVNDRPSPIGN